MYAAKEFWIGIFAATLGALVGLASSLILNRLLALQADTQVVVALAAITGFLFGTVAAQFWHEGWRAWVTQIFGIDVRSLAAIRIGLASTILIDLWMRVRDLRAHYSDDGILPLEIGFSRPSYLSLHLLHGEAWFQLLLFIAAGIFAVLMLVGYRTRWMTILTWLMLVSLQGRNPLIGTGGDTLLRMLLFWGMFLPLGARYSVDSALNVSLTRRRCRIVNVATFALLVQLACMYSFSGFLKSHPIWTTHGSAAYYALSLDMLTTPFGTSLLDYPRLLRASSFFVLYLECYAPLLIFFPWRNGVVRNALAIVLFAMHFSFQISMYLGVFPLVAMVTTFTYLSTPLWDRLQAALRRRQTPGICLYYDASCAFCKKMALLTRTALLLRVRIRRGNVDQAINSVIQKQRSWVVVDASGTRHLRFEGLLVLLAASYLFRPLAWIFAWRPLTRLGNRCYRFVAGHRKLFGKATSCLTIHRWPLKTLWPLQPLVVLFLVYVVLYNFISVPGVNTRWMRSRSQFELFGKHEYNPEWIYWSGRQLRLDQNWLLFGPHPMIGDGWFVVEGEFKRRDREAGQPRTINPWSGQAVEFEKPDSVADSYVNNRWRKLMEKLRKRGKNPRFQLEFCKYICREWNRNHDEDEQLKLVRLYFVKENTRPPHLPLRRQRAEVKACNCSSAGRPDPDKPSNRK